MEDVFTPDLNGVPLEDFFRSLREKRMLPSRAALGEEANQLEITMYTLGLRTMQDLVEAPKTKSRTGKLAIEIGLG